jgi:hypothetical protein
VSAQATGQQHHRSPHSRETTELVAKLNRTLGGWPTYFEIGTVTKAFRGDRQLHRFAAAPVVAVSFSLPMTVSLSLAKKRGACVIWIIFDAETMKLGPYLWFGGGVGEPLPALGDRVARHTKADKAGVKAERPNLRVVGRGSFKTLESMEEVVDKLFGRLQQVGTGITSD